MRVFGKLNLFLDVFSEVDGYHPIQSVFSPMFDIYDEISVSLCDKSEAGVFFAVADFLKESQSGEFLERFEAEVSRLSQIQDNAKRAVVLFCEKFSDFSAENLRVDIVKGIPFLGGMGGSSADAVGVLKCLCEMTGRGFSDVCDIANSIGSDLAGMWSGGVNFCSGRGENAVPIANEIGGFAVCVTPDFGVSTREVFKAFDLICESDVERFCGCDVDFSHLESFDYIENFGKLKNSLEKPAFLVQSKMAEFADILREKSGVDFRMTGSGSGMFYLAKDYEKAVDISCKIRDFCSFCRVSSV